MSLRDIFNAVARQIFFDNSTNGFTSTEAQSAIEEAASTGASASRGPTIAAFDGTGSTGRWLEFYNNNPSNTNPFIVAESSELIAVSIVTSAASATGTVAIYKNGSSIQTISLAAQKKNAISGLAYGFVSLDELSLQVTSGSIARPQVYLFIRTLP